ncbi:6-bladed beta-propeller [Belliella marina]|uniref:6-bladed beta-propeller n=1 Tax=Belliella marina TaxID=1644146 RepID=A0ABW4VI66_9BACT
MKKISFSFSLICLFSCAKIENTDLLWIDVDKNGVSEVLLSDVAEDVSLVTLQTNEESFITFVSDLKFYKNNLYVKDGNNRVLVFGHDGVFLKQLGIRGEGPGEYQYVNALSIDTNANLIYLGSQDKLLVFSAKHELLNEKKLGFYSYNLESVNNKLYVVSQSYGNPVSSGYANQTTLYELTSEIEVEDTIPARTVLLDKNQASTYGYEHFISVVNEEMFLYTPVMTNEKILRDTLYQLEGKSLIPYVKFNFDKPHIDDRGIKNIWIYNIINSKSYIICEYSLKGQKMFYLYSKRDSKGYKMKEGILDSRGDAVVLRPLDLSNDVFYFTKKEEFSDVSIEEPNPIVRIVKLK